MQCIENWCPTSISNCIRMSWVYLVKKFKRKEKSYQGLNELEQEQFRFKEKSQKLKIFSQEGIKKKTITDNLDVHNSIEPQKIDVEMEVQLLLNQDIKQHQHQPTPMNILEEEKTNVQSFQNNIHKDYYFQLNIDPFSPYYGILSDKTQNVRKLLESKGQQILIGQNKANLKIYQIQNQGLLTFILNYRLPCTYSYYSKLMSDNSGIFKGFNGNIDTSSLLQCIYPNLKINYLSLGKFMVLQPRQFTYLKYTNGKNNNHWQICITLQKIPQHLQQKKQQTKKITGQFYSINYIKQLINNKNQYNIYLTTYLEIDLKSAIKAPKAINRGLIQIKNYIQKLYQYSNNNFQEQLA